MSDQEYSFGRQLQRNAVALISILIAISSLGYNTWRNEKSEDNRNERVAAFEILLKLGELQQVVFHHYYDNDSEDRGNPRTGWTYVLTIRDLSRLLPSPMPAEADRLLEIWSENWKGMEGEQASVDAILNGIERTRNNILELLKSLE